jgi:hypothetical protein
LKAATGTGFAGMGLQNLERLRLSGQNTDTKGVRAVLASSSQTAFALAMLCCLKSTVKVGGHMGLWKIPKAGRPDWLIGGETIVLPGKGSSFHFILPKGK